MSGSKIYFTDARAKVWDANYSLPYKYEEERSEGGMTALAGLPVYLDLASVLGMGECIRTHLKVREGDQGWTDEQAVL